MHVLRGPQQLVLARHGESRGNVADLEARQAGADRLVLEARDADMPLSATGTAQARALGRHIAGLPAQQRPTAVYSSPYVRAATTAALAVEEAGAAIEVQLDERLRERELGELDGMTGAGIRRAFPSEAARRDWLGKYYYRPPSGESWADVLLRVRQFLMEVSMDPRPPERLWLFSHQAVILAFRCAMEGLEERQILAIDAGEPIANGALTRYDLDAEGRWNLVSFADDRATRDAGVRTTAERANPDRAVDDD